MTTRQKGGKPTKWYDERARGKGNAPTASFRNPTLEEAIAAANAPNFEPVRDAVKAANIQATTEMGATTEHLRRQSYVPNTNPATAQPATAGAGSGSYTGSSGTTTVREPWHVPKWLVYAGGGLLALALYGAAARTTSLPPFTRSDDRPGQNTEVVVPIPTARPTYTPRPTPTPTVVPGLQNIMSNSELLSTASEYLNASGPIYEDNAVAIRQADQLNRTAYFKLTGETFEKAGFETRVVPQDVFDSAVHPNLRGVAGTIVVKDGKIFIYASLPASPQGLLSTLARETGQARFTKYGPKNIDVGVSSPDPSLGERGGELADALWCAAVFNFYREAGIEQMYLKPLPMSTMRQRVDGKISANGAFADAWSLAWGFALDDSEAYTNLNATGWAGSSSLVRLYDGVAMLNFRANTYAQNVQAYSDLQQKLRATLANENDYAPAIAAALERRVREVGTIPFGSSALP